MKKLKKAAVVGALGIGLALGGVGTAALAGGAGGGTFTCSQSGVPNWGTVRSQYNHNGVGHYATAVGKGRQTVSKPAGYLADAAVGRSLNSNACYWGTY
ncbi:lactococcin 972 family bacteriocin [Cellulomonas taurus]|uniref:lactococcin 972 family bacteriocin n=1 Tax=Cellulomonas taurus TaxID=2729175 RepID=UPI00145C66A3|nr:lactococcin 972 family bacteriocin [Cellulomonas taurus]